ncbi:hypothetical protein LCGC14_0165220 [marine sediment metagenome]|uniref:NADPH-dependent FMN reductase-like domain-containing protein n=1 Tax=marine sediment metagenome TaxID=412755 RepID=A0A0F9XWS9_9ZZZZ
MAKISGDEFIKGRYVDEWWQVVDLEEGRERHAENIRRCQKALNIHGKGPIRVLAVHGSSRSNVELSCAHELSNSQLLLREGLEAVLDDEDVEIREVNLREYQIEYCNNCYSTCSALCGFPCNCFPFDPMQDLYPEVLACDVLLLSTGVNQSAMSSRLKAFCDRLISMDGGYFVTAEQFASKNEEWRDRCIALSQTDEVHYDQRQHGRVAAFFISSKDEHDHEPTEDSGYNEIMERNSYVQLVADSLYRGFWDFGYYMPQQWVAMNLSHPNEELSFDKARLNDNEAAHEMAQQVVRDAVFMAKKFRIDPPEPRMHPTGRT